MILLSVRRNSVHVQALFSCSCILMTLLFTVVGLVLSFSTDTTVTTSTITRRHQQEAHKHAEASTIDIPWLIVGGGIHGVHIATRLLGNGGISPSHLCIVDDNESLLKKWKSRTAATGMEYLRSSAGFHLDLDEHSLRRQFGQDVSRGKNKKKKKKKSRVSLVGKNQNVFSNDYERPRLDVFNQHCDSVVEKYGLNKLHTRGVVTRIEPTNDLVRVVVSLLDSDETKNRTVVYTAKNVILALGNDDPTYEEWVNEDDIDKGLVEHLFDQNYAEAHVRNLALGDVAVIGAGLSGSHKVLELVRAKQNAAAGSDSSHSSTIHLISRHPIQEQQFDTHQDWMMDRAASIRSQEGGGSGIPKRQRKFSSSGWKERRMTIAKERVPGTVTPAIHRGNHGLCYAIENGDIQWHQAQVLQKRYVNKETDGSRDESGRTRIELTLSCGETIGVDKVLLATGFGEKRPGGKLIQDLIEFADLKVSDFCGYPICDENLLWHPRIFVAGALAELELGPSARNIAGARLAAERILQAIELSK